MPLEVEFSLGVGDSSVPPEDDVDDGLGNLLSLAADEFDLRRGNSRPPSKDGFSAFLGGGDLPLLWEDVFDGLFIGFGAHPGDSRGMVFAATVPVFGLVDDSVSDFIVFKWVPWEQDPQDRCEQLLHPSSVWPSPRH